jgi:energy-coupling factor transporter ATP-binding protein EcfA2
MSVWDTYPATYRQSEVQQILSAVRAGNCVAVLGLSGAGKSNLLGFIAQRVKPSLAPGFLLVDCNRLRQPSAAAFLDLLAAMLAGASDTPAVHLDDLLARRLAGAPHGLCLLVDRLDALPAAEMGKLAGNLRALRDAFKYALTFVIGARQPVEASSELAELFFAHTLWLGALSPEDARWSAASYAQRAGLQWDEATLQSLVALSRRYPSLLRACCEAHAAGAALSIDALREHPAVRRRADEIWSDHPSPEVLAQVGLASHPLLGAPPVQQSITRGEAAIIDTSTLTAAEHRLMLYFQQHAGEVCEKDDLIQAVWPEEVHAAGLRDDSLAQLVRRLRLKIETEPSNPTHILTVPGRGYRYLD